MASFHLRLMEIGKSFSSESQEEDMLSSEHKLKKYLKSLQSILSRKCSLESMTLVIRPRVPNMVDNKPKL